MKKVVFSIVAALIVAHLLAFATAIADSKRGGAVGALESVPGRIDIRIGSAKNVYQGGRVSIPITVSAGSYSIGGFHFLIGWNSNALNLEGVRPGLLCQRATGELGQFDVTYTQVELPTVEGACGNELLSSFVKIAGAEFSEVSDTTLTMLPTGDFIDTLCFLEFRTTGNRLFEGTTQHIHFVWYDCGDNIVRSFAGDTLHLAGRVYIESDSGDTEEISRQFSLPSTGGLTDSCFVQLARSQSADLLIRTNYFNGQVSFVGFGPLDSRGDINLNGIENEVADAELLARYFVYGDSVLSVYMPGQVAASDVNKDGITLSLEDFVYLLTIIYGNEIQGKPPPSKLSALFRHDSSTSEVSLTTGDSLGAALLLFVGNAAPTLFDDSLNIVYFNDRSVTRVLVWPKMGHWIVSGPLLRSTGDLVHVDALTSLGGAIRTEIR